MVDTAPVLCQKGNIFSQKRMEGIVVMFWNICLDMMQNISTLMCKIRNLRADHFERYSTETGLSPQVKYFYWSFKGGTSLLDHLCYFCIVFVMLSRLLIAALWSPAGKGLTSWLAFGVLNCVIVTFPFGILGQVWYLIVPIPDLCPFITFILYA